MGLTPRLAPRPTLFQRVCARALSFRNLYSRLESTFIYAIGLLMLIRITASLLGVSFAESAAAVILEAFNWFAVACFLVLVLRHLHRKWMAKRMIDDI